MYSAEITRNSNLYRLELDSIGTGTVKILVSGLSVTYEQQEIDKRYQPSLRGSLKCSITFTSRLQTITGCSLYKNGSAIFRGFLNNLDEKQDLLDNVNYITDLEFGDYLKVFDDNSIGGEIFSSNINSVFVSKSRMNIKECFLTPLGINDGIIVNSDLSIRVDDNVTIINPNGRVFKFNDEPDNLYFDIKPYFNKDLTALESIEDICKSIICKVVFIGDQMYIYEETSNYFIDELNLDESKFFNNPFVYNTIEPKYNRNLNLLEEENQEILLNNNAYNNSINGVNEYIGINATPFNSQFNAYIESQYTSGSDRIQVLSNFAHNARSETIYSITEANPFNYSFNLDTIWNEKPKDRSFKAYIILGFCTSTGKHYYQRQNGDWSFEGTTPSMGGTIGELNTIYTDQFWTIQQDSTTSVNNTSLTFSGKIQESVAVTLSQEMTNSGNGIEANGQFYIFINRIIESDLTPSGNVAYYVLKDISFTSVDNSSKDIDYSMNQFDYKFNTLKEGDTEEINIIANNNETIRSYGGQGLIGSKYQESDSFIKISPYYRRPLLNYSIGFDSLGASDFSLSLNDSISLKQNSNTGLVNDIIEFDYYIPYVNPLSKINYNNKSYFPTNIECNIEEGISRITMINLI